MAGKVDLGNGGTYYLSEHPNWRPQSGTDTSGDRHVHSLYWALPLLYRGVHKQNAAMVERFRQLMYYWINDHKGAARLLGRRLHLRRPAHPDARVRGADAERAGAHRRRRCATPRRWSAATASPPRDRASARTTPTSSARPAPSPPTAGSTTSPGRDARVGEPRRRRARRRASTTAATSRARPATRCTSRSSCRRSRRRPRRAACQSDNIPALRGSLYQFVAQAVRPDFKLESLGDTINPSLRGTFGLGDGAPSGSARPAPPAPRRRPSTRRSTAATCSAAPAGARSPAAPTPTTRCGSRRRARSRRTRTTTAPP